MADQTDTDWTSILSYKLDKFCARSALKGWNVAWDFSIESRNPHRAVVKGKGRFNVALDHTTARKLGQAIQSEEAHAGRLGAGAGLRRIDAIAKEKKLVEVPRIRGVRLLGLVADAVEATC